MSRSRRLLTAVVVAASISGIPAVAGPADGASGPTVEVHGRLLVVPSEVPGGTPSYGVAVAGGDIVPVSGRFDPDVRTGAVFDGRLAIPTGVVSSLARRGDSGATAALKLVDRRSLTLTVVGSPSVT